METWAVLLMVLLPILLLPAIIFKFFIIVVHQAEGIVIERLGKFSRVLQPGINFIVPILDAPRAFSWTKTYIDVNQRLREEKTELVRIDMREALFNFTPWEVFTRDTVNLSVNLLMFYKIYNVRKAIYGVDDLHASISNVAQAEIKIIMGSMTFTEVLTAQDKVNALARVKFNQDFRPWGVVCTRLEILNISPPANISRNLKMQMLAERKRRAEFVEAEGKKSYVKLESDGVKVVKFQTGVAEQEATRKRSEGQAEAKIKLAQAESAALTTVSDAIRRDGATQTEYKVAQRYMRLVESISAPPSSAGKTIYLPYAAKDIMGTLMNNLPNTFGSKQAVVHVDNRAQSGGLHRRNNAARRTNEAKSFDDLN